MGPSKEKIEALEKRMVIAGIKKNDIYERFVRGSGRGGQKLNKTSSAVFIKHLPTGFCVKCDAARSRHLNRFLALRKLVENIETKGLGLKTKNMLKNEKIRKQKKRRKQRAEIKNIKMRQVGIV